mmetsp:Transcript_23389/g.35443  ORF Transcript_23389/g.35443 Transcript_23389/m.35443 type:complete len:218 (-) Transcript_23389:5513-6166(-)
MNCPGQRNYDPSKPWVSKVRKPDGRIAADFVSFVDDFRPSGPSSAEAWRAARRTASVLNFLGIQDAARKRRDSSKTPGAWTGLVVKTSSWGVELTILERKWKKAKALILEVKDMVEKNPLALNCKRLEQICGYLVYITRTFPATVPYVIGLHLTIDGWWQNWYVDGWRCPRAPKRKRNEDPGSQEESAVAFEDCEAASLWSHSEGNWARKSLRKKVT